MHSKEILTLRSTAAKAKTLETVQLASDAARSSDITLPYLPGILASAYLDLNRVDEAKSVLDQALARNLDNTVTRAVLCDVAALQDDKAGMQSPRRWNAEQPAENNIADSLISSSIQQRRLKEAREVTEVQLQALQPSGFKELMASHSAALALAKAELGDYSEARRYAALSAKLSRSRTTLPLVAIALSLGDEPGNVEVMVEELNRHYPRPRPRQCKVFMFLLCKLLLK